MNQYLVEFDVWLKVWDQDVFYRQQCAIVVWADDPEEATEDAKNVAKCSIFVFPPHIFHHFGDGTKVSQIYD